MHYVSIAELKEPLMRTKDAYALWQLRRERCLKAINGIEDARASCGFLNGFEGPELSAAEQELLMIEQVSNGR